MTRFSITMNEAIEMALWGIKYLNHGQTLIPKLPSYRVLDLAKIFDKCKIEFVGIRQGEKIHEDLIGTAESLYTIETKKYYILYPNSNKLKLNKLQKKMNGKKVEKNFSYSSGKNDKFLNKQELTKIINSIKQLN